MLSFLATDMRVGITAMEGTLVVAISTYSDEDYAIAVETKNLERYPLAAEAAPGNLAIQRELEEFMKLNDLAEDSLEYIRIATPSRTSFGRIESVGDEHVLVRLGDHSAEGRKARLGRRKIIPKSFIGSIELNAMPVRFGGFPLRTSSQTGE